VVISLPANGLWPDGRIISWRKKCAPKHSGNISKRTQSDKKPSLGAQAIRSPPSRASSTARAIQSHTLGSASRKPSKRSWTSAGGWHEPELHKTTSPPGRPRPVLPRPYDPRWRGHPSTNRILCHLSRNDKPMGSLRARQVA